MPINIEWQVKPPSKHEEKPQMFPRITDSPIVGEQQLAELIAAHGSLSRGNAKTALNDLVDVMATLLREGKTINLPQLGSFKLSIGTDVEIHPDSDRRMKSIVVRGVNFQPAQAFMDAIGKPSFQWRPTTGVAIAPTAAQFQVRSTTNLQTGTGTSRCRCRSSSAGKGLSMSSQKEKWQKQKHLINIINIQRSIQKQEACHWYDSYWQQRRALYAGTGQEGDRNLSEIWCSSID